MNSINTKRSNHGRGARDGARPARNYNAEPWVYPNSEAQMNTRLNDSMITQTYSYPPHNHAQFLPLLLGFAPIQLGVDLR